MGSRRPPLHPSHVELGPSPCAGSTERSTRSCRSQGPSLDGVVNVRGQWHTFIRIPRSEHWAPQTAGSHGHANAIVAPFPAVVAEVHVEAGQNVDGADPVVVIEAMKMLHTLTAGGPGVVADVRVAAVGDQVESPIRS